MNENVAVVIFCIFLVSAVLCQQCSRDGVCTDRTISQDGDVRFAVLASMHEPGEGDTCGDISIQGVQSVLAVKWITDILNGNGNLSNAYIPGVKLGFDIYDDCGMVTRAIDGAIELLPHQKQSDLVSCINGTQEDARPFAGVLAFTSLEATSAVLQVVPTTTPLISAHVRSRVLEQHDNVFFTVPSVTERIQATLSLINSLEWYFLTVVYTDEEMSDILLKELLNQKKGSRLCVGNMKRIVTTKNELERNALDAINSLEKTQSVYSAEEKIGVLFIGGARVARVILKTIEDQKSTQSKQFQWIFLSNVKGDSTFTDKIRPLYEQYGSTFITGTYYNGITYDGLETFIVDTLKQGSDDYQPWVGKYVDSLYPCAQTGCSSQQLETGYMQSHDITGVVMAMLSMVSSLKKVHEQRCSSPGLCEEMKTDLQKLLFNHFTSNQEEVYSSFPSQIASDILQIQIKNKVFYIPNSPLVGFCKFGSSGGQVKGFKKIGEFNRDATLNVSVTWNSVSSCKDSKTCDICKPNEEIKYGYVHGDILILGIFSLHQPETGTKNFKCGSNRNDEQSILTVLAFLQEVKQMATINGKTIGALALDDCYSGFNVTHLLLELFSGRLLLLNPAPGVAHVDMNNIRVAVGALSSGVTLMVEDVLTPLNIPIVSYGASSAFLDNKKLFPYFLRTVPSDKLQAQAMVQLLRELNFTYVGAIYIDNSYGYNGIVDVEENANKEGICFDRKHSVTESSQKYGDIEKSLSQNLIKVVVFYGINTVAKTMLDSFTSSYIYIASEAWGKHEELMQTKSKGSLIFRTDTSVQTDNHFEKYLKSITPKTDTGNPWMETLWESALGCNFVWSFDKRPSLPTCDVNSLFDQKSAEAFSRLQRVVHTSYAAKAIWTACNSFRNCTNTSVPDSNYAKILVEHIKKSKLTTVDNSRFSPFASDGNGAQGLSIYNIQRDSTLGSYSYVRVGSFNSEHGLSLDKENVEFYNEVNIPIPASAINSHCTKALCGNICRIPSDPTTTTSSTPPTTTLATIPPEEGSVSTVILIVLIVVICVILCVVVLLIVLLLRQHRQTNRLTKGGDSVDSHHMSMRSINNMYEDIQGVHNEGFIPSTSSGIEAGSSGGSHSTDKPIEYSDVQGTDMALRSNQNVSDGSHSSSSRGTGFASNTSAELGQYNQRLPQDVVRQAPMSIKSPHDVDNLTYLTARDFNMRDEEEVSRPNARQRSESTNLEFTNREPGARHNISPEGVVHTLPIPKSYGMPSSGEVARPQTLEIRDVYGRESCPPQSRQVPIESNEPSAHLNGTYLHPVYSDNTMQETQFKPIDPVSQCNRLNPEQCSGDSPHRNPHSTGYISPVQKTPMLHPSNVRDQAAAQPYPQSSLDRRNPNRQIHQSMSPSSNRHKISSSHSSTSPSPQQYHSTSLGRNKSQYPGLSPSSQGQIHPAQPRLSPMSNPSRTSSTSSSVSPSAISPKIGVIKETEEFLI